MGRKYMFVHLKDMNDGSWMQGRIMIDVIIDRWELLTGRKAVKLN